ncbi:hypothetical protein ACHAXR_002641 [Thalassiosira sp. AJA248-18]
MKTTQALALVTVVFGVATDAVSIRGLFKKGAEEHTDDAAANNEAISAHNEAISANNEADQSDRRLDCSTVLAWHPTYSAGWTKGYCQFTVDCNSPSYGSELACCKGAYGGQTSGYCISQLDSPPTQSPTESGGLDVYYPDYATPWAEAGCINTRPLPSGRPTYSTMISCCKGAYAGQMSGEYLLKWHLRVVTCHFCICICLGPAVFSITFHSLTTQFVLAHSINQSQANAFPISPPLRR